MDKLVSNRDNDLGLNNLSSSSSTDVEKKSEIYTPSPEQNILVKTFVKTVWSIIEKPTLPHTEQVTEAQKILNGSGNK